MKRDSNTLPPLGRISTGSFSSGFQSGVWVSLFQGTSVMSSKGMPFSASWMRTLRA